MEFIVAFCVIATIIAIFICDSFFTWLCTVVIIWLLGIAIISNEPAQSKKQNKEVVKEACVLKDGKQIPGECPDEKAVKEEATKDIQQEEPPKEEPKDNHDIFEKFSKDSITGALIECDRNGNQVYVSSWLYIDGDKAGQPVSFSVWPRLKDDGRPYKCEESKQQEDSKESKKKVIY